MTDALVKILERQGAGDALALTWYAAAIGDTKMLNGRKPNFQFLRELLDRTEGKVREEEQPSGKPDAVNILREKLFPDGDPDPAP